MFQSVEVQPSVEPSMPAPSPNHQQFTPKPPSPTAINPNGGALSVEQRGKLQSELDVVQSNMLVFGEMLNEMKPGSAQQDEIELLQELNATLHDMQERLMELINKLANNDELTADLLRINDDLNNLFLRYSRWEKNKEGASNNSQSASTILAKAMTSSRPKEKDQKSTKEEEESLIDLDATDLDLTDQLNKMSKISLNASDQLEKIESISARNGSTKIVAGDDEFDMFAQSRTATYEKSKRE